MLFSYFPVNKDDVRLGNFSLTFAPRKPEKPRAAAPHTFDSAPEWSVAFPASDPKKSLALLSQQEMGETEAPLSPRQEWLLDCERFAVQAQARSIGRPEHNTLSLTHDEIFRMKDPK